MIPMPRSTWLNILIILLVIIAASYLAQVTIDFLSGFSDIILIVILSWLVAYALSPLVERLNDRPLPRSLVKQFAKNQASRISYEISHFRVSRPLAVGMVYLGLAILVFIIVAALIPAILAQVNAIVPQLSRGDILETTLVKMFGGLLERLDIAASVQDIIGSALNSLQAYATPLLQNTVSILTSVLSLLGNALLVILLSFFLALDGPRFTKMIFDAIPERLHQETRMFILTTDRAFGGFLRAQILQAAAIAIGTAIILWLFGIQAALLSGLFAGLFMLIPLLGPLLALLPPLIATLLTNPGEIFFVMVPLIILQIVVVNLIMPRIMGDALGLHPLVIIVSLLIGVKIAGFWGAFFAMPLAGVISAFGAFLIRRRQRLTELTAAIVQQDSSQVPPLEPSPMEDLPEETPSGAPIQKESRA